MGAKKRAAPKRRPEPEKSDRERIADLAAELQDTRDRVDALTAAAREASADPAPPPGLAQLRELGASLDRIVEEVRSGELDRAKLVAMASAIAAIARLIAAIASSAR